MTLSDSVVRLLGVVSLGMVFALFRMALGWLDRRLAAPIMSERINEASDKFLIDAEKDWGESEIDSIVQHRFGKV